MTQAQLIQKAVEQALAGVLSAKQPKAVRQTKAQQLAAKDARLLRGFARKGIKNVVLMDRSDLTKQFNVRPWKGWVARGQIVKAGEKGVQGLFHETQTREMTTDEVAKFTASV